MRKWTGGGKPGGGSNSFNGAATLSLRKCENAVVVPTSGDRLQWGRNFIVAEIRSTRRMGNPTAKCFNGAATLSLRKFRAGAGARTNAGGFNGAATLSLRKLEVYETTSDLSALLQWGRNFIVAEMCLSMLYIQKRKHASMGPQLYRCGNRSNYPQAITEYKASMGPQLYRCGNDAHGRIQVNACALLQWGRNFIVAEICYRCVFYGFFIPASMGPQLYRCGNEQTAIS